MPLALSTVEGSGEARESAPRALDSALSKHDVDVKSQPAHHH